MFTLEKVKVSLQDSIYTLLSEKYQGLEYQNKPIFPLHLEVLNLKTLNFTLILNINDPVVIRLYLLYMPIKSF